MSALRGHRNPQSIIALEKRVNVKQSLLRSRNRPWLNTRLGASNNSAQAVSAGKLYRHRNNRRNSPRIWVLIIHRKPYRHSKTGKHRWALNPLIDGCTQGSSILSGARKQVRICSFGVIQYRCRITDVGWRICNLFFYWSVLDRK